MCYFITATLDPSGRESAMKELAKQSLLRWEALHHAGVLAQLPKGSRYYFTTRGMCDCATELGAKRRTEEQLARFHRNPDRAVEKLKKRGWSSVKIDRWVEQTRRDATRKQTSTLQRLEGPHPELARWVAFLHSALEHNSAAAIGILLHWYNGPLDCDTISLDSTEHLSLKDLTEDLLHSLVDDHLLVVSR